MRKINLVVESTGAEGLFAYLPETSLVTYGDSLDEIMDNILRLVDQYNSQNPDDCIEVGELEMNVIIDDDSSDAL